MSLPSPCWSLPSSWDTGLAPPGLAWTSDRIPSDSGQDPPPPSGEDLRWKTAPSLELYFLPVSPLALRIRRLIVGAFGFMLEVGIEGRGRGSLPLLVRIDVELFREMAPQI